MPKNNYIIEFKRSPHAAEWSFFNDTYHVAGAQIFAQRLLDSGTVSNVRVKKETVVFEAAKGDEIGGLTLTAAELELWEEMKDVE